MTPRAAVRSPISLVENGDETLARTKALDPGDTVEYGMSVFVRHKGQEVWLSTKINGTVREGESGARAARRIEALVEDRISRKVAEFVGDKE